MTSWRNKVTTGAKLGLGLALLAYVVQSNKIDFVVLKSMLSHPVYIATGLVFLVIITLVVSIRWFFLVRAQGLALDVKQLFELTMIGNFFNTFMPGAVGGDVIKAWYVAGREPTRKTKAIFTVLLDRAIGLAVFFLFAATALAFHYEWLQGRTQLQVLAFTVWGVTAAMALAGLIFFTPFVSRIGLARKVLDILRRQPKVAKLLEAALLYRSHFTAIAVAVVLSCLCITANILLYQFQGNLIQIPMDASKYFFVIPVALTVSAVPLLPGGIGVGQMAFFTLFKWMDIPNPEQGSTLCTAIQIYTILFNSFGAIFYVRVKRKPGGALDSLSAAMK